MNWCRTTHTPFICIEVLHFLRWFLTNCKKCAVILWRHNSILGYVQVTNCRLQIVPKLIQSTGITSDLCLLCYIYSLAQLMDPIIISLIFVCTKPNSRIKIATWISWITSFLELYSQWEKKVKIEWTRDVQYIKKEW